MSAVITGWSPQTVPQCGAGAFLKLLAGADPLSNFTRLCSQALVKLLCLTVFLSYRIRRGSIFIFVVNCKSFTYLNFPSCFSYPIRVY